MTLLLGQRVDHPVLKLSHNLNLKKQSLKSKSIPLNNSITLKLETCHYQFIFRFYYWIFATQCNSWRLLHFHASGKRKRIQFSSRHWLLLLIENFKSSIFLKGTKAETLKFYTYFLLRSFKIISFKIPNTIKFLVKCHKNNQHTFSYIKDVPEIRVFK